MEKEKVLLIEDDEVIRKLLHRLIEKEGFTVFIAEDGFIGLEIFNRELPDIVITDLKLPKVDGLEVLHNIKRINPNSEVILITGHGDFDIAMMALREGAIDYLKKPFDLDEFVLALGRAREKVMTKRQISFSPTVLIAEDEETTRIRLARVLEKEEWKILQAGDGEEAISLFVNNKIDVVLIDVKMPKIDGLSCLHELRKISNDFEAIILTGFGDENSAIQAMREGAINFIRKPIDLEQLIVSVQKAFEKIQIERALRYRVRELELTKEIIAKITTEKEIVVDVRNQINKPARDFAQKLINCIPIGILIIDDELNIIYTNEQIKNVLEYEPEKVDEKLVSLLARMGIKELNFESFKSSILNLFMKKEKDIETISVGKYAFITSTKMIILEDGGQKNVVISVFRGERS